MASISTKLIVITVLINCIHINAEDEKSDEIIKSEETIVDYDIPKAVDNNENETDNPGVTEYITTERATQVNKNGNIDDSEVTALDNDYTSTVDNVLSTRLSNGDSQDNETKTESTTIQTTTKAMEPDTSVVKTPELADTSLDLQGQRNPKTDNSDSSEPIDKRTYDSKTRVIPVVSKTITLKSWIEDDWNRPPTGILVPLRPMALNRALAVWNDLSAGGLNLSDIIIIGYDSNGVNWRSRHNLQSHRANTGGKTVAEALSKLLLKYQGVHTDYTDGTMRALTSAAKLVPYDSALFVVTDQGPGDPQRLPLALRALVEKRLKVYTIWTDPNYPGEESEAALQELRNISRNTDGDVLPYSIQVMEVDGSSNLASEAELLQWHPEDKSRHGRLESQFDYEKYDTLLLRRGGGEALSLGVPVETGVRALRVFIEGAVEHAVLYPPNEGPQIDLYNDTSVAAFSLASRTEGLLPRDVYLVFPGSKVDLDLLSVLPAATTNNDEDNLAGVWHLSVKCDTCDYRLHISATSQIHFDVDVGRPGYAKLKVTGLVANIRETLLVDEYGKELAKLPFNHTLDEQEDHRDPIVELGAEVMLPDIKRSKMYIKVLGRDTLGEPFVRLAGPVNHPETRLGRSASAAIVFADSSSDLERAEEFNSKIYSRNDSGLAYTRAVSQLVSQRGTFVTTVQIGLSTRLYGAPGDNLQLHFEVTNYREQSESFQFGAVGEQRFLTGISPRSQNIAPRQTTNVVVSATIPTNAQPGLRDTITFTAYGLEQVSIVAYIYVSSGQEVTDVWPPEVRHNFQGSCWGRTGSDCAQYAWSATIIARDNIGGLLRLSSSPIGVIYDSSFISGTREEVVATYRATCCAPRVVVNAVDAYGNANSYVVDISYYITPAGIAAIVLGVFLAIALILLIAFLIYWCVRRSKESREIPSYNSRTIT